MSFSVTLPHTFADGPGNIASGVQVMDNLNALISAIDTASATWTGGGGGGVPTGAMFPWPKGTAPTGYLFTSGQPLSTATYPALFAVCNYAFGGSGATFNLPHTHDRFVMGAGTFSLAGTGGEVNHTLTVAELADHRHIAGGTNTPGAAGFTFMTTNVGPGSTLETDAGLYSPGGSFVSSGQPHNNLPPYLTLCYIIKT